MAELKSEFLIRGLIGRLARFEVCCVQLPIGIEMNAV